MQENETKCAYLSLDESQYCIGPSEVCTAVLLNLCLITMDITESVRVVRLATDGCASVYLKQKLFHDGHAEHLVSIQCTDDNITKIHSTQYICMYFVYVFCILTTYLVYRPTSCSQAFISLPPYLVLTRINEIKRADLKRSTIVCTYVYSLWCSSICSR